MHGTQYCTPEIGVVGMLEGFARRCLDHDDEGSIFPHREPLLGTSFSAEPHHAPEPQLQGAKAIGSSRLPLKDGSRILINQVAPTSASLQSGIFSHHSDNEALT